MPLALALGLLVLGGVGLLLLHRRAGADANAGGEVTRVGEFVPTGPGQSEFRVVGDVRPGHVGTVADERVDPIDVTASLVDLAVRGHLTIVELPREHGFAGTDWDLARVAHGPNGLLPFEQQLLDGIVAPGSGSRCPSWPAGCTSRSVAYRTPCTTRWSATAGTSGGRTRPAADGPSWPRALIVAVVVTAVLAAFTTFGLVGLALVVLALGLIFVGQEMPSRTPKGAALLGGLSALRSDLLSHPTDQMPPGAELRELSEVLPYAIVLGGADRWLDAIVAADTDEAPRLRGPHLVSRPGRLAPARSAGFAEELHHHRLRHPVRPLSADLGRCGDVGCSVIS